MTTNNDHNNDNNNKSASRRVRNYCSQCYVPTCDFRGPCRFPHGCCYSTMAVFSGVGGLLMNLYMIGSCFFQRIQQINPVTGDPIPGTERGYGFLSRETDFGMEPDYKQCTWYPAKEYEELFDVWMHTGRIFACISALLASICFAVLLLTCCMAFSPSMFERWLFWMYIVAAITTACSFFIFGSAYCSDNDCKVADGSGWAISAFMFHLVSANTVKSFGAAKAPQKKKKPRRRRRNQNNDDEEDDDDEELDDLWYETLEDKYPPPRPDGPRGVIVDKKSGNREYDNGEDYYDDLGRLVDPDEQGQYKDEIDDDDDSDLDSDDDDDLDDISDDDLDEYDSDNEDEDDQDEGDEEAGTSSNKKDKKDKNKKETPEAPKYDENGNLIFDPNSIDQNGNLGVGYDDQQQEQEEGSSAQPQQVDEFGNPIFPQVYNDEFGNPVDENGNLIPVEDQLHLQEGIQEGQQQFDENGNPIVGEPQQGEQGQQYDEFGNPILPTAVVDEYGNTVPQHDAQLYDEYGDPNEAENDDPFGQPYPQPGDPNGPTIT